MNPFQKWHGKINKLWMKYTQHLTFHRSDDMKRGWKGKENKVFKAGNDRSMNLCYGRLLKIILGDKVITSVFNLNLFAFWNSVCYIAKFTLNVRIFVIFFFSFFFLFYSFFIDGLLLFLSFCTVAGWFDFGDGHRLSSVVSSTEINSNGTCTPPWGE